MTDSQFWSKTKKKVAASLLAGSVGIIAKGKNCVIIYIKSPNTIYIPIRNDAEVKMFLWGLSGTGTDRRELLSELTHFLSLFRSNVSPRDVNIALVGDFISTYLTENLYRRNSEKTLALEFILGQVFDRELLFSGIDFEGEIKLWGEGEQFAVIGCTAKKKRNELQKALSRLKFEDLGAKELAAALKPLVREFKGGTLSSEFIVDGLERPNNDPAE